MEKHAESTNRNIRIVNLDPAAEKFDYQPLADIRELIQLDDVLSDEDIQLGNIYYSHHCCLSIRPRFISYYYIGTFTFIYISKGPNGGLIWCMK